MNLQDLVLLVQYVQMEPSALREILPVLPAMPHAMDVMDLPLSVSNVQQTMSQHLQTLALPVHTETTLLRETILVLPVMLRVPLAMTQRRHV